MLKEKKIIDKIDIDQKTKRMFDENYQSLNITKKVFNYQLAKKYLPYFGGDYNFLVTLIIYFNQLENRFKNKLTINR